ncbi:regulatory protein, ArsR [Hylemonella gracilis ATCC 19624]|uniref:Regulatory protein, ArsR n=2 Tax=Hylemonella gracilis TaxID=80880 RepID=F3KQ38_9BURK|nr:regulatory protein, ArsR [Hylemonella gracilis ATCC 19624]
MSKNKLAMESMPLEALRDVAAYFQALSEPTRLMILNQLRGGEANVSELAEACACSVANVSRHLTLLSKHGLVERDSRGANAYYRIADPSVNALCDLVCGNIARHLERGEARRSAFQRQA